MGTVAAPSQPTFRFADSFWDDNDHGVNVMLDKLYTAKQTCEEIKNLFEIRSQIEEEYGERLLKLSQTAAGHTERGTTLAESLAQIPTSLETSGRAHLDLAQQLKDHLEAPLDGFLREQRDLRRMHHQQIENARQLKNMHHTNAIKAREFYHSECQRVSAKEKTLRELGSEMSTDQRKKIEYEVTEGRKMILAAEKEYCRAVDVLNGVTRDWIDSWKSTCNVFQEMEERRIRYIHGSLRSFANMISSVYLVDEQCCDRINTTLELTDVSRDMDDFSMRYGTGTEIPGMLQFEPYVFETYEEAEDPSAQVTPASSVHESGNHEQPKSDEGDQDQENGSTGWTDAPKPASTSVVVPALGSETIAPAPVAVAATAATEEHTRSVSPSPEDEAPAPTTPPSLATGAHDVKKPDQNDRALLVAEAKSPTDTLPDAKCKQAHQAPYTQGPVQEQQEYYHQHHQHHQQQQNQQPEHQDSELEGVATPSTGERWVISSVRRPQQLPVRAQNVRMSTVSPILPAPISTPPVVAPPHVSAPVTPAINNKFYRPNAPVKIEIPEKPTTVRNSSAPVETFPQRRESLRQHIMDNNINDPGNNKKTTTYNSGADISETSGKYSYGTAPMASRDMYPAEATSSPVMATVAGSKKGPLSSFMKNIRKPDNNKESKRFSMNIFGSSSSKKDASKHMSLDEVFDHSEMASSNISQTHYTPPHLSSQLEDGSQVIEYVSAMWSFDARIPNEMSFTEGDTMAVLHKQPDGWWVVELMDPTRRQRGLVPGNYMQSKKD